MIPESALASRSAFESYCRTFACETFVDGQEWACILGSYDMRVFTKDIAMSPHFRDSGFWEAWVSLRFARDIDPGDSVLDVGANLGYYTMLACDRSGPSGSVVAVEPNAELAVAIMQAIRRNRLLDRAHVVRAATWEKGGLDMPFNTSSEYPTNGSLMTHYTHDRSKTVMVRTATIDDIVRDSLGGHVDLIKIDVEGAEQKTWLGMQRALDANPDCIVIMEVATVRYPETALAFYKAIAERFWLRAVGFDGEPRLTSMEELLAATDDVMLYLSRRGET